MLSLCLCLSVCLSVCLSISLSISVSLSLSLSPSLFFLIFFFTSASDKTNLVVLCPVRFLQVHGPYWYDLKLSVGQCTLAQIKWVFTPCDLLRRGLAPVHYRKGITAVAKYHGGWRGVAIARAPTYNFNLWWRAVDVPRALGYSKETIILRGIGEGFSVPLFINDGL